jgi:hypothetical protein
MVRKPKPVSQEVRTRLVKAAQEARDAEEVWRLKIEQRDEIVVEAIDEHGAGYAAVAQAIGVAKGRISSILSNSQPGSGEA